MRVLVVPTSYGVGETKGRLPLSWTRMFALLLQPQIRDTERQEREVRESGLDWVLAQPVGLTDDAKEEAFTSPSGEARGMRVSRRSVGRFLAEATESARYLGRSVALSAA